MSIAGGRRARRFHGPPYYSAPIVCVPKFLGGLKVVTMWKLCQQTSMSTNERFIFFSNDTSAIELLNFVLDETSSLDLLPNDGEREEGKKEEWEEEIFSSRHGRT